MFLMLRRVSVAIMVSLLIAGVLLLGRNVSNYTAASYASSASGAVYLDSNSATHDNNNNIRTKGPF